MKNSQVGALIGNTLSFIIVVLVFFLCEIGFYSPCLFYLSVFSIAFVLIMIRERQMDKAIVSPAGFFILSVSIFIMSRPFIYVFFDVDIVQVGRLISDVNITKTLCIIAFGLNAFLISFLCDYNFSAVDSLLFKSTPSINNHIINVMFMSASLLMAYFLYQSYLAAQTMAGSDYFSVAGDASFSKHIKWFFLSKLVVLSLLILSSSGKQDFTFKCSLLLFIGSIGFILIGLRGYTIAYFFLFLYFFAEKRKVNFFWLTFIALLILYISAFVLEYRLGFSVFNNNFEMLYMPIYQQGASFEVVFGAVNFLDKLNQCISFESFISGADFGACVDKVRGVPFDDGGFASSFFAEAYYLGVVVYLLFFTFMGTAVRYLDYLSFKRKLYVKRVMVAGESNNAKVGFLLFCLIPNLVYFARSGVMDFPLKFFSTSCILLIYWFFVYHLSKEKCHT
jgi:hypothetical protein